MLEVEVFIREGLRPVDTNRAASVAVQKVSALNHEVLDDSMEFGAFVALGTAKVVLRLACAELPEVFRRPWDDICEELHFDTPQGLAAKRNVEEHDRVGL